MTGKELEKELKRRIRKYSGKRCKDFEWSCPTCSLYMALDILKDLNMFDDEWLEGE